MPEPQALGARWFDRLIDWYDTCLIVVLHHQVLTLIVAVGTLVLTVVLYIVIPKGFFPVQDTGLIQGVTEAPQTVSFDAMASASRRWPTSILKDPDVDSLSSFIGVDGTNPTLNSGRMLINLKPRDDADPERQPDHPPPPARDRRRCTASRSTCSRCRT